MKPKHFWQRKSYIDSLLDKFMPYYSDDEIRSHLARYLCVLVYGLLETSVREILIEYSQNKASKNVSNYVSWRLRRFRNPKMENILDLIGKFNPVWALEINKATEGELKDAVDSIVANRHNIAHGESCNITLSRVKEYYEKVIKVIELIECQCNK